MSTPQSPVDAVGINPYRIHVSQRYLDLTRQKLELTRLPREPRSAHGVITADVGVTKSTLEPLVDHWLEDYNWREQETKFNDGLPQFRAAVGGTRLHYIHRTSSASNAVPLLFVHGWPDSFLTVAPMIDALCEPVASPSKTQPGPPAFHVVAPTIPGFGFSDNVTEEGNNFHSTAEMFDGLMKRLGYMQYMVHGSGWGFKIARAIALRHPESCLAVHTVNPDIPAPMYDSPMASGLSSPWLPDMTDLSLCSNAAGMFPPDMGMGAPSPGWQMQQPPAVRPSTPSTPQARIERPQTMSYALCDSPSGLLSYILDLIKPPTTRPPSAQPSPSPRPSPRPRSSPQEPETQQFPRPYTKTAIINWVMMHWIPGPEVALRWLANSSAMTSSLWTNYTMVPLGISHYSPQSPPGTPDMAPTSLPWAEAYHHVIMVRRRQGVVNFAAWERPAEVVMDLREMVKLILQPPPQQQQVPMTMAMH